MGLVVCPPLLGDFVANYRREAAFGRRLAAQGIAVWRFHYEGTGNSDGVWAKASFGGLCRCADEVARHLADTFGDIPIGFVGTRMSAFIAAASVADKPSGAPLILWDPVINPKSHFRQAFRAESMRNVKEKRPDSPSVSEMMSIMADAGSVDVLGYSLPFALYEQTLELSLVELLQSRSRPVLVVTMGAASQKAKDLVEELRTDGFEVTLQPVETEESWWFDADRLDAGPVVEETASWLVGRRIP